MAKRGKIKDGSVVMFNGRVNSHFAYMIGDIGMVVWHRPERRERCAIQREVYEVVTETYDYIIVRPYEITPLNTKP